MRPAQDRPLPLLVTVKLQCAGLRPVGAGGLTEAVGTLAPMAQAAEVHVTVGSDGSLSVAAPPQLADAGIHAGDPVVVVREHRRKVRSMLEAHNRGIDFDIEDPSAVRAENGRRPWRGPGTVREATTAVVADTHIVIWYLLNSAKLSQEATEALERCVASNQTIRVSAHSLISGILHGKSAQTTHSLRRTARLCAFGAFAADDSPFEIVPVTAEIANRVASVPRAANADPGDRIVVATAEALGLSIVSADPKFPGMTELTVIS